MVWAAPAIMAEMLGVELIGVVIAELVLGAGLEPACLSAYAPQTYVSAIPPPER